MSKSVTFHSDGLEIRGNLHVPQRDSPCVITLHGLEGNKDGGKWPTVASKLYDKSYACLRFNFRGCGERNEKSEGKFEELTLTKRIRDYKSAIDFLQENEEIDSSRLGVIGSSLGGMVAIASEEDRIKAMVTLSSPMKIPRYDEPELPEKKGNYYILPSGRKFKEEFYLDMKQHDLRESIAKSPPILIIQGNSDEIVPVNHAKTLFENANDPKKLKIVSEADHVFSDSEKLNKVIEYSLDWFEKYLS